MDERPELGFIDGVRVVVFFQRGGDAVGERHCPGWIRAGPQFLLYKGRGSGDRRFSLLATVRSLAEYYGRRLRGFQDRFSYGTVDGGWSRNRKFAGLVPAKHAIEHGANVPGMRL